MCNDVPHNISFLGALMANPRFRKGELTTNFIQEEFPDGFHRADIVEEAPAIPIVVAAVIHRLYMDRAACLSGQLPGHERRVSDDWVVIVEGAYHEVTVKSYQSDCGYRVDYAGQHYGVLTDWSFCQDIFRGRINGQRVAFQVERSGLRYRLTHRGKVSEAMVMTPKAANLYRLMPEQEEADLSKYLLAPMPGLLVKLSVAEGDQVKAGQELAVIEAMKMENLLRAPMDATISRIVTTLGDSLTVDQVILEFA